MQIVGGEPGQYDSLNRIFRMDSYMWARGNCYCLPVSAGLSDVEVLEWQPTPGCESKLHHHPIRHGQEGVLRPLSVLGL